MRKKGQFINPEWREQSLFRNTNNESIAWRQAISYKRSALARLPTLN